MADDNKPNDKDKNPNKGGEFRVPPKTWIVWIAIIGITITVVMMNNGRLKTPAEELNSERFLQLLASNQITSATINVNPQTLPVQIVEGTYNPAETKSTPDKDHVFRAKIFLTEDIQNKLNRLPTFAIHEPPNQLLWGFLFTVLPFILIGAFIWFFFIRQIKMAGKGALSFGKSKARLLAKERNKTTF